MFPIREKRFDYVEVGGLFDRIKRAAERTGKQASGSKWLKKFMGKKK